MLKNLVFFALFSAVFGVFLVGCNSAESAPKTSLESVVVALQDGKNGGKNVSGVEMELLENAQALISRANIGGYKLITNDALESLIEKNEAILIAAVPQGIYNLGLIKNARNFEFAKSFNLNENGSEWNWEKDAFGVKQARFLELLESDKSRQIIFYDSGEDIFSPIGSAHVGIAWAKHLGYTNVARLIGGFKGWKDAGKLISFEIPECCANPYNK